MNAVIRSLIAELRPKWLTRKPGLKSHREDEVDVAPKPHSAAAKRPPLTARQVPAYRPPSRGEWDSHL